MCKYAVLLFGVVGVVAVLILAGTASADDVQTAKVEGGQVRVDGDDGGGLVIIIEEGDNEGDAGAAVEENDDDQGAAMEENDDEDADQGAAVENDDNDDDPGQADAEGDDDGGENEDGD